jgi:hypothetical protein
LPRVPRRARPPHAFEDFVPTAFLVVGDPPHPRVEGARHRIAVGNRQRVVGADLPQRQRAAVVSALTETRSYASTPSLALRSTGMFSGMVVTAFGVSGNGPVSLRQ